MVVHATFNKNRGCVAIDHRQEARTCHPTYVSLPYITFFDFRWRPFLGKNIRRCYPSIIENGRSWLLSTKMGVVWPLTINQRLVHLTPFMFPCHRSHSWIFGGDHLFFKNPKVLAFDIIKNGRSCYFRQNGGFCGHWSSIWCSYTSPHKCFLAIDHILGFLLETISWLKIQRC
jgi:hypothetical protein